MSTSILVVEDEPAIQELLRLNLEARSQELMERKRDEVLALIRS